MIGGTKQNELNRSAQIFEQVLETQGIYFALMFLLDCGYGPDEIKLIADRFKPVSHDKSKIRGSICHCGNKEEHTFTYGCIPF